jgi:hypothetical protein
MAVATNTHALPTPAAKRSAIHSGALPCQAIAAVVAAVNTSAAVASARAPSGTREAVRAPIR